MKNLLNHWRERRVTRIEKQIDRKAALLYGLDADIWPEHAAALAAELHSLELRRSAIIFKCHPIYPGDAAP